MKIGLLFYIFSLSNYSQINTDQADTLLISYQKTRCMGSCPAYQFEIYSSGDAFYSGNANVDRMGKWRVRISDNQLEELKNEFERSDFFGFEERYYAEISDLPTTYIFYQKEDQNKKVMDYYNAPQRLKELELKIESFIESLDWALQDSN